MTQEHGSQGQDQCSDPATRLAYNFLLFSRSPFCHRKCSGLGLGLLALLKAALPFPASFAYRAVFILTSQFPAHLLLWACRTPPPRLSTSQDQRTCHLLRSSLALNIVILQQTSDFLSFSLAHQLPASLPVSCTGCELPVLRTRSPEGLSASHTPRLILNSLLRLIRS